MIPGRTANAQLLCGYLTGLLARDFGETIGGDLAYKPLAVDAARCSLEVESATSGNVFRITLEQIGGTE